MTRLTRIRQQVSQGYLVRFPEQGEPSVRGLVVTLVSPGDPWTKIR